MFGKTTTSGNRLPIMLVFPNTKISGTSLPLFWCFETPKVVETSCHHFWCFEIPKHHFWCFENTKSSGNQLPPLLVFRNTKTCRNPPATTFGVSKHLVLRNTTCSAVTTPGVWKHQKW